VIDAGWNEFDLDGVCAGLAPLIAADDPAFAGEWEAMTFATQHADSQLHRAWLPCDAEIVKAWVEDRYEFAGESWSDFQKRIRNSFEKLLNGSSDMHQNIAVFTSGTPIALIVAATLQVDARRALRLAGTSYNSAFTSVAVKAHEPYLVTFNATPHLPDPALRTSR
jgi:broad specificity phosphatase PhoE